jgi:glucose-1-phosphate thymidylyltransferase
MKIRKAILTGGGRATRLHPVTTTINKHLLPLANKPMIFHAIDKAVEAGIDQIFINVNPGETELQKHIGDGGHWGVEIQYFEQTGGPQGIAHVVNEASRFIGSDPFLFFLSDNILLGSLRDMITDFVQSEHQCMLALSEVQDPQRFGVPVFDVHGVLVDVVEKPQNPPNNFAVAGIYLYGPKVFFDAFKHIDKSARGEYEISSIHSHFLKNNISVGFKEITGWWKDTGKATDLLLANKLVLEDTNADVFQVRAARHLSTQIVGNVHIGEGTVIQDGVTIQGPAIIGENCLLKNCTIGPYVTIRSGCEIIGATISSSIVLENSIIRTSSSIAGSIIGKKVQIEDDESRGPRRFMVGDKSMISL